MTAGQLVAGFVGIAIVVFILFRVFGRRGPKTNSTEVVMGVWSAFGPYESVDDAEASLYRSVRAVFGAGTGSEHTAWVKGHVDNFRGWAKSGTFKQSLDFMCRGLVAFTVGPDFEAACGRYKEEAKAQALQLLDKIATDLGMEKEQAAAMRASIDGSMPADEIHKVLETSQRERAGRIVTAIGADLLNSTSDEGLKLRGFLQQLSRQFKEEEATTPETLGLIYMQLLKYANDNADSEPKFAATLHALNDAWKATLANDDTEVVSILSPGMVDDLLSSLSQPASDKSLP